MLITCQFYSESTSFERWLSFRTFQQKQILIISWNSMRDPFCTKETWDSHRTRVTHWSDHRILIIHTRLHPLATHHFPKLKQTLSQALIILINYIMNIWVACHKPLTSVKKAFHDDCRLQRKPLESISVISYITDLDQFHSVPLSWNPEAERKWDEALQIKPV